MHLNEVRKKYLDFFASKGHKIAPSAPLLPINDPSTLFTSSGMQPMISYLLGETHPLGTRVTDSQKTFRSQDIEEVGDNRHTTFFEMLGNWSFGDYFKEEQLNWVFEFLTKEIGLDPNRLYVTVFAGNDKISRDTESVKIWQDIFAKVGIEAKDIENAETQGMQDGRIFYYGDKKNWWSRSGTPDKMPTGEPGGPDSEIFFEFTDVIHDPAFGEFCHVNCDCGHFVEIANSVFMEYRKKDDGSFEFLPQKNVDFGGGLERIVAASENTPDVFTTDAFTPIIHHIVTLSGQSYNSKYQKNFRIIADHLKAATMLAGDGVIPSNKLQGYVLRRLIRRAVHFGNLMGIDEQLTPVIAETVISIYESQYPELRERSTIIIDVLNKEELKFKATINKGLKEIAKYEKLDGKVAFTLYETFGFPFELTEEIARERGQQVEYGEFRKAFEEHQQLSRTTSAGSFKGGLADNSEVVVRYHTATHLMHKALRDVLGEHVIQKGSNITAERTRFDFSHDSKMTPEQIKAVEDKVNEWIQRDLKVQKDIMPLEEARKSGALGAFGEKYADPSSIYSVIDANSGEIISREFCGGPHVEHTGQIGHFKIVKEEAVSAGTRRIKAIIE